MMNLNEEISINAGETRAARITETVIRSIGVLFRKQKDIYKLFFSVTKELHKLFSISTAVLIVHSRKDDHLKVIAIRKPNYTGEGLTLTLPEKDSLFYTVFRNPNIYNESFSDDFEGNFVEKKLMLDDRTKSVTIYPIRFDGAVTGLVCLSSPNQNVFETGQGDNLESVLGQFGSILGKEKQRLDI